MDRSLRKILDFANENFQDEPNILYDIMTMQEVYFHFHGDSEMCAKLNRDILNFCIKHFGNNHKRTTDEKYNLILSSLNPKNENDAEEILQLTDDLRKVYKRHPSWHVATSLNEIADIIFNHMENYPPKYNSLIAFLRKNFYAPNDFQPPSPQKNLKENLREIKRLRRQMRKVRYNSEQQIELTERLIGIFIELKNFDRAAALQKKFLRNATRLYGKYSERMFYFLRSMRLNLQAMKRFKDAENLFSAGSISREDLIFHLDIFAGYLRHCLKRPAEAVKFQEKIVQILREVDAIAFSPTGFHIHWRRLIHCLKELGRIDDAQKISDELQALQKKYW